MTVLDQMSMPVLFVIVFVVLGMVVAGVLVGSRVLAARQDPPSGERARRWPHRRRRTHG